MPASGEAVEPAQTEAAADWKPPQGAFDPASAVQDPPDESLHTVEAPERKAEEPLRLPEIEPVATLLADDRPLERPPEVEAVANQDDAPWYAPLMSFETAVQ